MKRTWKRLAKVWNPRQAVKVLLAPVALLVLVSVVLAQGDYDLSWFTVDGGGGTIGGGAYTLSGTIGQPDAGVLSGGPYQVAGGFLAGTGGLMPPVATIDFIWYTSHPLAAVQGRDTIYFHGLGHDNDEGRSDITTYLWNSSIDGQLGDQEGFTIPASALSVGIHTITFKVQDDEGEWSPEVTDTLTVQSSPADVRTLILVNRQKLAELYSPSEAMEVMTKLDELAAHDSVKGSVVQVENDTDVAAAYTFWYDELTSTVRANIVTAAIKDVIDAQWSAHPDLEYLVIVGDDRAIPFHRVLDQVDGAYTERDYAEDGAVSITSTVGAALHDNMILSDDYYADLMPTVPSNSGWDGHDLYIPDLGTGRLIETPSEIVAQIDTFLANDEVAASSAIAVGYHFVTDAAQAMCDELTHNNIPTDCALIGEHWRREDFITQVLNVRHDIVSHSGHAAHPGFGTPPWSDQDPDYPSPGVDSSDVAAATANHTRALFYSLGCHAGLNVPPTNPLQPLDTAQALIQHQANYIANTGLGWGSWGIGRSEKLMLFFTRHLVYGHSATLGDALVAAKREYYGDELYFDYMDEKVMTQFTLYGLPMYRYTTPTTLQAQDQEAMVIEKQQLTMLDNGLTVNSISYQFPPLIAESTGDGLYYTLAGMAQIDDGKPIQPKYTADLSFPGTEAHGIVLKGGAYTDETSFDPVVDQAINEYVSPAEPSFDAPGWHPALLHILNSLERRDTLVTTLGQFNPSGQVERVYDRLSFDVYYHTSSDDWTGPRISRIESTLNADTATITVWADDTSGIHTVVVAHTDGDGVWSSSALTQSGDSWTGDFPASAETRFFVQAVDSAGNVAVDDNEGLYYQPGEGTMYEIFLPLVLRNG